LLESVGRTDEAQQQYDVFVVTQQLFGGNGVQPDAVLAMFEADHGDAVAALAAAEAAMATNPFVTTLDAYAWALHRNGRHAEALVEIDEVLSLGMANARFHFHAGRIALALGDEARARLELSTALRINPHFHPIDAESARAALADLGVVA
jgi:hypothetical protein